MFSINNNVYSCKVHTNNRFVYVAHCACMYIFPYNPYTVIIIYCVFGCCLVCAHASRVLCLCYGHQCIYSAGIVSVHVSYLLDLSAFTWRCKRFNGFFHRYSLRIFCTLFVVRTLNGIVTWWQKYYFRFNLSFGHFISHFHSLIQIILSLHIKNGWINLPKLPNRI